jgi:hypothetical protein
MAKDPSPHGGPRGVDASRTGVHAPQERAAVWGRRRERRSENPEDGGPAAVVRVRRGGATVDEDPGAVAGS